MNRWAVVLGGIVLVHMTSAVAQTLYVDDRLQVGLHTQPNVSSTISQLLSSGSELQLLERNGTLAKVRTADGAEGWVDGNYLSETQPARARILEMENELAGAQAELADLQAKFVVLEQSPQQKPRAQSTPLTSEALREMQLLAEENQRLKQQVAELEAVSRMAQERTPDPLSNNDTNAATAPALMMSTKVDDDDNIVSDIIKVSRLKQWHLILLASVLLLAFSIGGWLVDWGIRRRHGGFRV
ncbi:MAG: SH3 domain protein [Gammaproteobacteria bacterium]